MHTSHSNTDSSDSAAIILGKEIRQARNDKGWTIAELAERIGRPREWLNRVELGYSEYGEFKPPSAADLKTLIHYLGNSIHSKTNNVLELGLKAEKEYESLKLEYGVRKKSAAGKLTQAEVIIGENQISQAIVDLIKEQHSDAIIRNTGIKSPGSYLKVSDVWKKYREALGEFLESNPNGIFKRVEYAANNDHLELAKEADTRLAGKRRIEETHNARIKFHKENPFQLHLLIGQREAILALPQTSGQAGSSIAILVRDKIFVEALRVWYDEVLWEGAGDSCLVKYSEFEESFSEIKDMYGFAD